MSKKNSKKTVPELRFRGFTDPWEQRQLGEVAERTGSGGTPSSSDPRYYGGSIPFLGIGDITGRFVDTTQKTLTKEGLENSAAWVVPQGAISLAMYASYGKSAILSRPMATSQAFFNVVFSSDATRDFIYSRFQCAEVRHEWDAMVSTGTQPNLSGGKLKKWEVSLPPQPEQRLIGRFFSTLDSLIAAAERQETLLRQKKQAYLQLMFPCEGETQPRLRFSGFSGDWEQRQSSELFVPVKENGHSDLPVLSATQSEGMVYRDDQSRDIKFKKDNLGSYKLVRAGDFVISLRSFQGGFELSDKTGIVSPAYTVFTHAECSSQDNGYWKQYFKRRSFIESLKTVTFGIRDGKAISFSDFSSLKCIFPTLPEQRLIGRFFSTLDSLIAAAEERTRALKEMKSAYLQRMFV